MFAGQKVGIKEVAEKIWLVSFMQYDLGFFDEECGRVECAENAFGPKVSSSCRSQWAGPVYRSCRLARTGHTARALEFPVTGRSDAMSVG